MKMITAIINKMDANDVSEQLTEAGFMFTKIGSTGGILSKGNVTLLIGVNDDQVTEVLDIIRKNSAQRMENVPTVSTGNQSILSYPNTAQVLVGGATVFVTDVTHFEKM